MCNSDNWQILDRTDCVNFMLTRGRVKGKFHPYSIWFQICSDEYGTSGAIIILAGLAAHIVIGGMLMRAPYTWELETVDVKQTKNGNEVSKVPYDEEAGEEDEYVTLEGLNGKKIIKRQQSVLDEDTPKCCSGNLSRNSSFLAYCLMMGTGTGSISLVNAHFAGLSIERGISLRTSSYLISSTGALLIVCRLVTGICFDIPCVRAWRKEIMGSLGVAMGVALVVMVFTPSALGFIIPFAIFIVAQSVAGVQYGVVLSDIISKDDYIWALGILRLCRGFGFLVGPLVGGKLHLTVSRVILDILIKQVSA